MTSEEFWSRAGHPPAPYGLSEALNLLRDLDAALKPREPSSISIVDGRFTIIVWRGSQILPFHLEDEDLSRPGSDIAKDILRLLHR